jgi:hypothetical protein
VGIAIALSLIPTALLYGPQAALIAESFGPRLRYSGAGIGYHLASVIAGGPAPFIAAARAVSRLARQHIACRRLGPRLLEACRLYARPHHGDLLSDALTSGVLPTGLRVLTTSLRDASDRLANLRGPGCHSHVADGNDPDETLLSVHHW